MKICNKCNIEKELDKFYEKSYIFIEIISQNYEKE